MGESGTAYVIISVRSQRVTAASATATTTLDVAGDCWDDVGCAEDCGYLNAPRSSVRVAITCTPDIRGITFPTTPIADTSTRSGQRAGRQTSKLVPSGSRCPCTRAASNDILETIPTSMDTPVAGRDSILSGTRSITALLDRCVGAVPPFCP